MLKSVIRRLREPSTWAAVSVLLLAVGVPAPLISVIGPGLDFAAQFLGVGAAVAAAVLPERGGMDDAP